MRVHQNKYTFAYQPIISIIVPVYNTKKNFLMDMIWSVITQTYSKWELCIVDGGSNVAYIRQVLKFYSNKDNRIKIKLLNENKGISGNSNEALKLATGEYIGFMDHDDIIPVNALYEIVKCINENKGVDFIYTDEDKLSENGKIRFGPVIKPDWSLDTLKIYNYITHFFIIKRDLLNKIEGFRCEFDGAQDYDLILRAAENAEKIVHIPKILYHWRMHKDSVAGNPQCKLYAYEAGKKVLEDYLRRNSIKGIVEYGDCLGKYKIIVDEDNK